MIQAVVGDRILVKEKPAETKTPGGIIIPDMAKDRSETGTIVMLGDDMPAKARNLKVGTKIMYDKYAGAKIKVDDDEYVIMKFADVLCIL
jgi:chaperonin GroES